ncbi:sensor domain-containing diguanylate cyclase [Clostridium colicanis]|uniref:Putative diguanylate cyclase AdrA n=2 Tax=Clostridium TaxID=1485 RepID=A0A151AQJ2_9CLOT|nr:sensor domain-containing diguanylate cyclase [Clostridium colicanis]KYH29677.1 putative diguanylate cyclase AdrA [Clostridium colicanis DSM 13634]
MGKLDILLLALMLIFASIALYEYILIKDIKKSQEFMEKMKEKFCKTSEKILMTENEDEIYSIVLDTVVDLIPNATKGSILLMDKNENFYFKAVKGFENDLIDFNLRKEEAYLYSVNKFKETAIIENPKKFDETNISIETIEKLKDRKALDIYCTISAPIYVDNKLIGLLNVDSSKPGYVFTKKELNLMNLIKSELQIALKNAFAQNKLKYLANFDELTGVMNRRRFNKELSFQIEKAKQERRTFCLVMIDLDNFKKINDTYGHNFGDKVLRFFSHLLESSIDKSDIVARLSGDEFAILFLNCSMDEAKKKMARINEIVSCKKVDEVAISFSYGICEVEGCNSITCTEALILADVDMYNNKKLKKLKGSLNDKRIT